MANVDNLIDLDFEDDKNPYKRETTSQKELQVGTDVCKSGLAGLSPSCILNCGENNPFDEANHLANIPYDPFECVAKEACFKAAQSSATVNPVKCGKLLSLSNDNLLELDTQTMSPISSNGQYNRDDNKQITAETNGPRNDTTDFDYESPPVCMSTNIHSDNSAIGSEKNKLTDTPTHASKPKHVDYRKCLLKQSLSNSSCTTPVSRSAFDFEAVSDCTDESRFMKMSMLCDDSPQMLAAESPLKLIDDDLMTEDHQNLHPSNSQNFEADLKMLSIPMLKDLEGRKQNSAEQNSKCDSENGDKHMDVVNSQTTIEKVETTKLASIDIVRAKIRAKREENNNHEVNRLLVDLKALICDDVVDETKKQQANSLFDTLRTFLAAGKHKPEQNNVSTIDQPSPPTIMRQGTFDMEIQQTSDAIPTVKSEEPQPQPVEKVPDVMFSSSATYDGETDAEEHNLVLPKIEPHSPVLDDPLEMPENPLSAPLSDDVIQGAETDQFGDIIEQISRLLEQHRLVNSMQSNVHGVTEVNDPKSVNTINNTPTVIVVMNSSSSLAQVPNYMLHSSNIMNSSSVDLNLNQTQLDSQQAFGRRRSMSLSSHDKLRVQSLSVANKEMLIVDETVENPNSTSCVSLDFPELKTPIRCIRPRRNSFSVIGTLPQQATPAAATISNKGNFNDIKRFQQQRPQQYQGREQQTMIGPSSRTMFRPDMRRKSHASESIIKSAGPMKATLPLKKVVPMLKISSPPPESQERITPPTQSQMHTVNDSLIVKSGRMTQISTPVPISRNLSVNGIRTNVGYPSACSTPTVKRKSFASSSTIKLNTLSCRPATSNASKESLKRRTLSDFKSPFKPRVSLATSAERSGRMQTTNAGANQFSVRGSGHSKIKTMDYPRKNKENNPP